MTRGKITVLVGGQYGSEGKGAISGFLANKYDVHVRVGSPNAGHTFYWNGDKHVMQTIPCGWTNPNAVIILGRGALINIDQLMKEIHHIQKYYPDFLNRLYIDEDAGVLEERFRNEEGGVNGEMHRRIGSTGEGVGPARIARIQRDPSKFTLFKDVADKHGLEKVVIRSTPEILTTYQDCLYNVLIEGTQGSALSLLHSFWPYCTSIDTNASGIISEVGIPPTRVTDVIMVCRTFPIRVAGNSGPMKNEITWEEIGVTPEHTTVTKKIRRVARWDDSLFSKSCTLNDPTDIALTFVDYIDPDLYGCTDPDKIAKSIRLRHFIDRHGLSHKIRYVGTGPDSVVEISKETL